MQEIKIDPKQVRNAAAELKGSMSLIRDKLGLFRDIENEIEASWKSRYTRDYLNILEETEDRIRKAVGSVETIASNLDSIAGSAERAEQDVRDIMNRNSGSGGGGGGTYGCR
ncbi:MAG: hypothetical protein NC078_03825 [Ruminococcus sp.]|nr:hypothetical protein [Ruminococcus sp.]